MLGCVLPSCCLFLMFVCLFFKLEIEQWRKKTVFSRSKICEVEQRGAGSLGVDAGELEPTFCQIGWNNSDKRLRYPEDAGLEDCMISGPRSIWSYLNIELHWRVCIASAQQLMIVAARKHVVFKLRVLFLSSKCVHKIWVSLTALHVPGLVKLYTWLKWTENQESVSPSSSSYWNEVVI